LFTQPVLCARIRATPAKGEPKGEPKEEDRIPDCIRKECPGMVAFENNTAFSTKMSDPKWLSDASFVLEVINSDDAFKNQFVCSCKECGDELRTSGWPVAAEVCDRIVPGWPYPSGNGDDKFGGETGGETGK